MEKAPNLSVLWVGGLVRKSIIVRVTKAFQIGTVSFLTKSTGRLS